MSLRIFLILSLIISFEGAKAEDLLIDDFDGEVSAEAHAQIGGSLKYVLSKESSALGGVRHFSVFLNSGEDLRLYTSSSERKTFLIHEAGEDSRGTSVVVWDGDAESRGGNSRGLGKHAPQIGSFDRLILDDLTVNFPPDETGEINVRVTLFDREDATSSRALVANAIFTRSRSSSPYVIPLDSFVLNDEMLGLFSGSVGAISIFIDSGAVRGARVRIGAVHLFGDDTALVEEEPTEMPTPEPLPTAVVEASEQIDEVEVIEEQQPEEPAKPTALPRTPTKTPIPSRTPTPFYGRCTVNFDGRVICVKFPGVGNSECSKHPDCNTPTPTPTNTATGTPTPTPTAIVACVCACRSIAEPRVQLCTEAWVFRLSRFGYTCGDRERGHFPWSFEVNSKGIPADRGEDYCAEKWNGTDSRGYRDSSTTEPGEECQLEDCREGVLRRFGFMR